MHQAGPGRSSSSLERSRPFFLSQKSFFLEGVAVSGWQFVDFAGVICPVLSRALVSVVQSPAYGLLSVYGFRETSPAAVGIRKISTNQQYFNHL